MNGICLICYESLLEGDDLYHKKCCNNFFRTDVPPALPYNYEELGKLAENVIRSHITIPGVQTKISLNVMKSETGGKRLTIVGLWGRYILKPPVKEFQDLPANEDLTMKLAAAFKIKTVPHCLIPLESGQLCYITERIDRTAGGAKIQMEDMCQLTEKLTEQKYNGSYEQIAGALKKYSSNPGFDIVSLLEILLFSFFTGNNDMHLKNFSVIETKNGIGLSPSYDLLSTRLVIPEKDDPDDMALTLNGKKRKIHEGDFRAFALHCGLTEKQYENTILKFKNGFGHLQTLIEKSFLQEKQKEEYSRIIAERTCRIL